LEKWRIHRKSLLEFNEYTVSIKPGMPNVTAPHGVIVCAIDTQIPTGYSQAPVWLEYIFGQRRLQTCALPQIPCVSTPTIELQELFM
jgi:hypothetical protein